MNDTHSNEKTQMDLPEATDKMRGTGTRIAPAVALLLLADSVQAFDGEDSEPDTFFVNEPSTLGLLAAGAAVGGIVAYVRRRRRK